jgi:two-component system LytT family sensor kinase
MNNPYARSNRWIEVWSVDRRRRKTSACRLASKDVTMTERLNLPKLPLFVIATGFGLSSTFQAYWMRVLEGGAPPARSLLPLLGLNLVYWYVPALLAPSIMALALRYQLGRVPWSTQVLVHAAGALVYSVTHTSVMLLAQALLFAEARPGSMAALWMHARKDYLRQLDWLLMTYLFLVGLAHALAYRRESETRALDAAHLETRLIEARLQALQRQLHPHFLFNTLNTISGLMRINLNAADLMIDRLGDLLRMTLHTSGTQQVPLKQELEVLQKYLEIEQTRFESRLVISMQIDVESLDARVPNLLLQPLVENAIRHGIAPHSRPGWIAIRASREESRLRIEIRDSGNGLPPDRLMALNRGVGLGNTRARLEHLYPSVHQFAFSNLDEGFCVTVSIPFEVELPADEFARAGVA